MFQPQFHALWLCSGLVAAIGLAAPPLAAQGGASDVRSLERGLRARVDAGERLSTISDLDSIVQANPGDDVAAAFLAGVLRAIVECSGDFGAEDDRVGAALDPDPARAFWSPYFEGLATSNGLYAQEPFRRAAAMDPSDLDVTWRLARAMREAAPFHENAVKLYPLYRRVAAGTANKPEWLSYHLEASWALGDYAAVLADTTRILSVAASSTAARLLHSTALFELGSFDAALADLELVAAQDPKSVEPKRRRAAMHQLRGQPAAALLDIAGVLADDPQEPTALCLRGNLLWLSGDLEGALKDFELILEDGAVDPNTTFQRDTLAEWKSNPEAERPEAALETATPRFLHCLLGAEVVPGERPLEDDPERFAYYPMNGLPADWQRYVLDIVKRAQDDWTRAVVDAGARQSANWAGPKTLLPGRAQRLGGVHALEPTNVEALKGLALFAALLERNELARTWRSRALALDPSWESFEIESEASKPAAGSGSGTKTCPDC